jgi:hypothetical protein
MAIVTLELRGAEHVNRFLTEVYRDQLPFVQSTAINASARDFQAAQRAHQRSLFHVTRPDFVDRSVKIKPFATKARLEARISIDPPGGRKRADVIDKFEDQWSKRPRYSDGLWVPTDAVKGADDRVMPAYRPKKLKLKAWGRGPKARVLRAGGRGTGRAGIVAIIKGRSQGWIFERDGDDLELLFHRAAKVDIMPDLFFVKNANRVVTERWVPNFLAAFDRAMRTAR